jgi:hypothetical protein
MKLLTRCPLCLCIFTAITCTTAFSAESAREREKSPPAAVAGGGIVIRTAAAKNEDPAKAGKAAAEALKKALGQTRPHLVIMTECYDDKALKEKALSAVASVFGEKTVVGTANYGSFTQAGTMDSDSVCLLAIGGDGIAVSTAMVEKMGAAGLSMEADKDKLAEKLRAAGASLAEKLPKPADGRIMIVFADAHSPKNQFFIEGIQTVIGKDFPIVGGSACKNAGMNWLYYGGKMHTDSAVAVMLAGDFNVELAGRQAQSNDKVIATAREGSAEAAGKLKSKPIALLAFNCAGRLGKLDDPADELKAIKASVGEQIPIYGNYFAGEFGPADTEGKTGALCSGCGWHVMFALLGGK